MFVLQQSTSIGYVTIWWDDEGDEFCSKPFHFPQVFKSEFQPKAARGECCIVRHRLASSCGAWLRGLQLSYGEAY